MNEDQNAIPVGEDYREIERAFWQKLTEDQGEDRYFSQYRIVFENLIPKVRQSAKNEHLSKIEYELKLKEAKEVVDDIALALSAGWKEKKEGWIWFQPTLDCLKFRPDSWWDASPVNKSQLDAATVRYLQRPWMQLNLLDWYILNGYVFDELARVSDSIKSGEAIGIINWAYLFSGGDFEKTIYWRAAFQLLKFVARWILGPAVIILVFYFGYQQVANWLAVFYGLYLLIQVAFFPRRYLRRKAVQKQLNDLEDKLRRLINVYQSSSVEIFNPSRLRELIAKTESEEVFFRPAVYSILDRAIERDAAVFAIEGRG